MDTTCSTHVSSTEKCLFDPLYCKQRDKRLQIKYKPNCLTTHASKLVKFGISYSLSLLDQVFHIYTSSIACNESTLSIIRYECNVERSARGLF